MCFGRLFARLTSSAPSVPIRRAPAALVAEAKQCLLMPQDTAALPDFRSSLCRHGTSRVYRRPKEKTTPSRGMVSAPTCELRSPARLGLLAVFRRKLHDAFAISFNAN